MLDTIAQLSKSCQIESIEGVLNGTCNFLLAACSRGVPLAEAIKEAQRLGFAEADPSEDLSGRDAARKLTLIARSAFGTDVSITKYRGI
jgi:homoserine dehydrogenase